MLACVRRTGAARAEVLEAQTAIQAAIRTVEMQQVGNREVCASMFGSLSLRVAVREAFQRAPVVRGQSLWWSDQNRGMWRSEIVAFGLVSCQR